MREARSVLVLIQNQSHPGSGLELEDTVES